jgi:hypothetical protein
MSWGVSGTGTPSEVRGQLSEQFKYPLAEGSTGLADAGEKQTVQRVFDLCEQILSTFDPSKEVSIVANGHMGFSDWDTKAGAYQQVNIAVTPKY